MELRSKEASADHVDMASCRRYSHHRHHHHHRMPPCRPSFLSNHNKRCHCLMGKHDNNDSDRGKGSETQNLHTVDHGALSFEEMENKSSDYISSALRQSNPVGARQSQEAKIEASEEQENLSSIPPHNFPTKLLSPITSNSGHNSRNPRQFPFFRRQNAVQKRLEERRSHYHRSPFKLREKNFVIVSPFKYSKMIGLTFQLALLTFLSTSMIVVPACQATVVVEEHIGVKANGSEFPSQIEGGHPGGTNFPTNSITTQRLGESPSDIHKQGGEEPTASQPDSSHPSHAAGIINNNISRSNNNSTRSNAGGDVSSNVTPSQQPNRESRMSPLKRTKNGNTAVSLADPPFVRAHSTGFISFVTGDGTTKGSASSSVGALTGGKLVKVTPQLVGSIGGGESSPSSRVLTVETCMCWNTTDDGHTLEVECKCSGNEMTKVAGSLPSDIHRLTVEQAANFTTLSNDDLRPYGSSLNELVLSELPAFRTIKNGSFMGLKQLNTIYIHGTPALTQISDTVFNVFLPELKIIVMFYLNGKSVGSGGGGFQTPDNALVPGSCPQPEQPSHQTRWSITYGVIKSYGLDKFDVARHPVTPSSPEELENNKISQLKSGSFKGLVTEDLALSYNDLEEIGPKAFQGATIARLTLKGNPLKTLDKDSFVGIDSLRVLDLSETQITYLPTEGLRALESLRLEKVWTLSVIPSILHFQELQEAWLTWPYHCCAFEYPEAHDPEGFQRYKDRIRAAVNALCAKALANASTEIPETNGEAIDNDWAMGASPSSHSELSASMNSQRQKRHLRLFEQTNAFRGISPLDDDDNIANSQRKRRDKHWSGEKGNTQTRHYSTENNRYNNIISRNNKDYKALKTLTLSQRLITNEPLIITTSNLQKLSRLRKRSANGHQRPRQAQQRNGNNVPVNDDKVETGKDKNGEVSKNSDGFHHPHVLQSNNGNTEGEHPFENDEEFGIPYQKMGHEDAYDPFVFDPDQSFAPILDPNDLQRESDILGKDPWGTLGHANEAEFDEEIGTFHHSVTPSPTVITLCGNVAVKRPPKIECHPLPDAFNPCEDIMGSIWLRGAVWVVVALALFGNTAVLVVLLLAPGRISVQRFLMANLSWADLCMGLYLLMVATQDLVSLGSYFNYAIDWQLGWGCQIAGFLTVFASELSVFTLAVITGERWYALTRAIHLTKRLTLLGAAQLMAFGWFMAILLAALPLMGVSSYSKTSICLPMEASSSGAVIYLIFLLLFNGVAFLLVACAYWHMYRAVAGHGRSGTGASPAASSADTAIAKKMALLVFTDFACWAPVAFFGLTAVGGFPLIGVTDSKILLVFFYPLNACCNPYLYAILTKQYRRDLLLLLSRHGMCTKRAARYKTGAASTNNTVQTMQTVLRMGSMTETKVAGSSGAGRGSLLNGGRLGSVSVAGKPLLEDEAETSTVIASIPIASSSQDKPKNELGLNHSGKNLDHSSQLLPSPTADFRQPLNPKSPAGEGDEDDDVFDLNGLSGRHLAETTFISIPLSQANNNGKKKSGEASMFQDKDPATEALIQQQVEQHHNPQSNNRTPNATSPTSTEGMLLPDHKGSSKLKFIYFKGKKSSGKK